VNFRFLCTKILTCKILHGISCFTSHPREGLLRIFIALKNPPHRPGLNPRLLAPVASTQTTTPPRWQLMTVEVLRFRCRVDRVIMEILVCFMPGDAQLLQLRLQSKWSTPGSPRELCLLYTQNGEPLLHLSRHDASSDYVMDSETSLCEHSTFSSCSDAFRLVGPLPTITNNFTF
jgi:hypothetical protein